MAQVSLEVRVHPTDAALLALAAMGELTDLLQERVASGTFPLERLDEFKAALAQLGEEKLNLFAVEQQDKSAAGAGGVVVTYDPVPACLDLIATMRACLE